MSEYDKKAAQYRKEAAAAQSPTPTPVERKDMEAVKDQKKQADASKEAYDKASPIGKSIPPVPEKKFAKGGSIRGSGCETTGKTKGRMV
jgi:hypothetical protein